MVFINERIPPADLERYRIEEVDKRYVIGGTSARSWTIDREEDIYLREVAVGREDGLGRQTWTFGWKGRIVEVDTLLLALERSPDGHMEGRFRLLRLELPNDLSRQREQIVADFLLALTARKDAGIYSTAKTYSLTLEA